jgi:hypothetical protein
MFLLKLEQKVNYPTLKGEACKTCLWLTRFSERLYALNYIIIVITPVDVFLVHCSI